MVDIKLPKDFAKKVLDSLDRDRINYKHLFYNWRKDQFYLVKQQFTLVSENRDYYDCYDGNLFGTHIPLSRTKSWEYIGEL